MAPITGRKYETTAHGVVVLLRVFKKMRKVQVRLQDGSVKMIDSNKFAQDAILQAEERL